ncbi:hypothetical protein PU634_05010 [Oceanimonas pelagia]|uniref:Uncharacterized protein n=1 Tax=Oceanimonas pelagia TaxID=3028314 RepID=A0AA50KRH6_9GAMM|nr:hypothetical protein [Oceanimonas pelagia]WMC11727.1 hypothetical protein PU634_05010 [Oceanimonas pelagia]
MGELSVINQRHPGTQQRAVATANGMSPTDQITVLLTNTILPAWCVHYPGSAGRIDSNLPNMARVYTEFLTGRGLTVGDIRAGHLMALEQDREFAPRPAEFLDLCREAAAKRKRGERKPQISLSAVRMIAESSLYLAGEAVSEEAISAATESLLGDYRARGVDVVGSAL